MSRSTLRRDSQFRTVYSTGERIAGERVVIYYLRRDEKKILPGFVASRKIGKSVIRNKAKRIMREVFRRLAPRFKVDGLWIVFVAAFNPKEHSFREVLADVEALLVKAGLIEQV